VNKMLIAFVIFNIIFCGSSSPILSEDDCSKVKYIHADSVTKDTTCLEEGVFAIPHNCQDYYECDSTLQDYYKSCPNGEQFNGTGCGEGNKDDCPQKLCPIVYENSADINSTMASTDMNPTQDGDGGEKTTESILTTIVTEKAKSAKQTNSGISVVANSKNIFQIILLTVFCNFLL